MPYEKLVVSGNGYVTFDALKSLHDKTKCDSYPIPADIVANLISKEEIDWSDDERYEPESDL